MCGICGKSWRMNRTIPSVSSPCGAWACLLYTSIDAAKVLAELEAEQAKAAAEAAPKEEKTAENVAFLSQITIDDFAKIDLRVAEITDCEPVKKAKKLLRLTLDDGSGVPRTVCSGIAKWSVSYTHLDVYKRQVHPQRQDPVHGGHLQIQQRHIEKEIHEIPTFI